MRALGYPCTWPTSCFIRGGCGQQVFGHTNGHGDFVLFDTLGPPWEIHHCYHLARQGSVYGSRNIGYDGRLEKTWEYVREISAEDSHRTRYNVVGTVTNTTGNIMGTLPRILGTPSWDKKQLLSVIGTRKSFITVCTGEGEEFTALYDSKLADVDIFDIVACSIKRAQLFNAWIFLANNLKILERAYDGD